jgi:phenylacetate-CoA ligase
MANYWRLMAAWYRLITFQYRDIEKLRQFQLARFKKILLHAYNRVPMYREIYDAHGFMPSDVHEYADIEKTPLITKDMIRGYALTDRIDPLISEHRVYKKRTSGTTGEPIEIWEDRTESIIQTLRGIRALRQWGYSPFHRTVRLWGGDLEIKKSIVQKLGLFRRQDYDVHDGLDAAIATLVENRCEVLYGSRSSLEVLLETLNGMGLIVKPQILASISETLADSHRSIFEKGFGCHVLNLYGCEEMGVMAWGCPDFPDNLHIGVENLVVNFRSIKQTDHGRVGSIIVTHLSNYVMPFIRYDLGDLIELPESDRCPCGRSLPLLGKILGRNEAPIEYKGKKYYWHFFQNQLQHHLDIRKYQIINREDGEVEFRIQLFRDTEDGRKNCASDLFSEFGQYFSPLIINFVDNF